MMPPVVHRTQDGIEKDCVLSLEELICPAKGVSNQGARVPWIFSPEPLISPPASGYFVSWAPRK